MFTEIRIKCTVLRSFFRKLTHRFGAKPQYGGSRGGRGKRNNPNLNKTVLITFGPHKGYYGTVKVILCCSDFFMHLPLLVRLFLESFSSSPDHQDATDSVATVELQSNGRRVQFPLASMLVLDDSDRSVSLVFLLITDEIVKDLPESLITTKTCTVEHQLAVPLRDDQMLPRLIKSLTVLLA